MACRLSGEFPAEVEGWDFDDRRFEAWKGMLEEADASLLSPQVGGPSSIAQERLQMLVRWTVFCHRKVLPCCELDRPECSLEIALL